jgi:DNA-binding NarL/FixJ family response regulator
VASEAQHAVVILYKHALLGEGIATYLRAQVGVEATVASARDPQAVTSALALGPAVVIFESSDPFQQFDLTTLAPHAVLIDVSTVITRGSVLSPGVAGLEQILQAVRDSSIVAGPLATRPVPSGLYRKSTVRRMGSPE